MAGRVENVGVVEDQIDFGADGKIGVDLFGEPEQVTLMPSYKPDVSAGRDCVAGRRWCVVARVPGGGG